VVENRKWHFNAQLIIANIIYVTINSIHAKVSTLGSENLTGFDFAIDNFKKGEQNFTSKLPMYPRNCILKLWNARSVVTHASSTAKKHVLPVRGKTSMRPIGYNMGPITKTIQSRLKSSAEIFLLSV
jgi:hypothetical protein